jgi:cysteine-rich repeat protein
MFLRVSCRWRSTLGSLQLARNTALGALLLLACSNRSTALSSNDKRDASTDATSAASDASKDLPPGVEASGGNDAQEPPEAGNDVYGAAADGPPTSSRCGNGVVERGEQCDDGNTQAGDGCSRYCQIDDGPCVGCVVLIACGDGILSANEACDDGNDVSGDGCAADCQSVEPGWRCRSPGRECAPVCGDLVVRRTETCDDGNTMSGDGCSVYCLVEAGWDCSRGQCTRIALDGGGGEDGGALSCGDGIRSGAEECDLGVDSNSDTEYGGCTTRCFYGAFCGDGEVNGPEACDLGTRNGARVGPEGCTRACSVPPYCGDGIVDVSQGEACDLGELNGIKVDEAGNPSDAPTAAIICLSDCTLPPTPRFYLRVNAPER